MKIKLLLPTYGQVADFLKRSSPGLQTKHNLVRYLIEKDLEILSCTESITLLNNQATLQCKDDADSDRTKKEIGSIVKRNFIEVLDLDLDLFFEGRKYVI